jgi:hypothetical protein
MHKKSITCLSPFCEVCARKREYARQQKQTSRCRSRNKAGQFTKTKNPKSERVYLTSDELALIQALRLHKIDPTTIKYPTE